MWAERLMLEKKGWNYRYFLTLSYAPENQTYVNILDKKTGEIIPQSNLIPDDMTLFLKEYRRKVNTEKRGGVIHDYGKVKYYYCGEYGDREGARHFHAIIFQEKPIDDLKYHTITKDHNFLYRSDKLNKMWEKGYVWVGEVSINSAGYVARYVMKKQTGEAGKFYDEFGIQRPFVRMSNGIGMEYFKEHYEDIYRNDEIIIGNQKLKPCRAFDEAFWEIDPATFQNIKDKRREAAITIRESTLKNTTLSSEEYLKIEAMNKDKKYELLRREL